MKFLVVIVIAILAGCSRYDSPSPCSPPSKSETAFQSATNVLAEPLPGRKVKISVTARDESLYIVNCNEHVVVSLRAVGAPHISWGGVSNGCLSQSIIIPAKATLSFVVELSDGSPELDTTVRYTALVGGVHQSADIRSPQVPVERMTSNSFKIIP
ncbi:hypothetical protein EGK58_012875 [Acinetobacter variabilis]|nr:hypothetical protein C3F22_12130 [Acinetobacter sp. ACNIH1]QXR18942.1 hypothetical protein EGK58_012875 [Acinetobacter variabilis]